MEWIATASTWFVANLTTIVEVIGFAFIKKALEVINSFLRNFGFLYNFLYNIRIESLMVAYIIDFVYTISKYISPSE